MRIANVHILAMSLVLTACSATGTAAVSVGPAAAPDSVAAADTSPSAISASITQQRRDQIKRVVSLRIAFSDSGPVAVTDVRLNATGFVRQLHSAWNHRPVLLQPNVPVALPIALTGADCRTVERFGPATALITVTDRQGQSRRIEVTDLPDDGLLDRIRHHDCAVAALQERATFTLGADWRPGEQGGRRVWRGSVDIARSRQFGTPIEVIGALGSVLVDFTPARPLPWRVPDQARSRLPIVASSSGRCDGHSMGESSKPFVFTLWVRADGVDVPLVLTVPTADLPAWWDRLSKACAEIRQGD